MGFWVDELISAGNSSGGFHSRLFKMVRDQWQPSYSTAVLVGESNAAAEVVKHEFPRIGMVVEGMPYPPDFNVAVDWPKQYDVVISQATLEHVCRPSVMVENLVNLTSIGGLVSIHTHHPNGEKYHRWPIDCCRFYPDFFSDLGRYLPWEVIECNVVGTHIFALCRRLPWISWKVKGP